MMVLCFLWMTLGLIALIAGQPRLSLASLALCLLFSAGLFLFEVYSPVYGFRMPWIQG